MIIPTDERAVLPPGFANSGVIYGMTQNDFYARLDEYMDSETTFDLIPPLITQAKADNLSILAAFQKNDKGESVAAYGMLQGHMFLLCAPKWDVTEYEAYTLAETEMGRLFDDLKGDAMAASLFKRTGPSMALNGAILIDQSPAPTIRAHADQERNTRSAVGGNSIHAF